MTDMKRVCFAINNDTDRRLLALRKTDKYVRLTYSELIRKTLAAGLLKLECEAAAAPAGGGEGKEGN